MFFCCSVSALVLVFLVRFIDYGGCNVIIKVGLVRFVNPTGKDWSGEDCEMAPSGQACDHLFTMCIDGPTTNDCHYKRVVTKVYHNADAIVFTSDIGEGQGNPITMRRNTWEGALDMTFTAVEIDHDKQVVVDRWHLHYDESPEAERAYYVRQILLEGLRTTTEPAELHLEIAVFCEEHFYNPNCSKHCRSDPQSHYTCDPSTGMPVCLPGWESDSVGFPCGAMDNECLLHHCQNGGFCVDLDANYTCVCPERFTGPHCEYNIHECPAVACQNGGTCHPAISGFQCTCVEGYVGDFCEHGVCGNNTAVVCLNGGTCIDQGQCLCPSNYTGTTCETDICNVTACDNGGQCHHGLCVCPDGFNGPRCENETCDARLCRYGGTCRAGGHCACARGYTGAHCEMEINECVSRPCEHKGTCDDLVDGYQCRCLPGYNGTHCEIYASFESHFSIPQAEFQEHDDNSKALPAYGVALLVVLFILALLVLVAVVLRHWFSRYPFMDKEEIRRNSDFDNPLRQAIPAAPSYDNPNGGTGNELHHDNENQPIDQIRRGSVQSHGVTETKEFENPIYKMEFEPDVTSIKDSDDVVVSGQRPVATNRVLTKDDGDLEREPATALEFRN